MLSKRADAFEDATRDEAVKRDAQYERARELLDEQADILMQGATDGTDAEPQHAPYNPHRRPLSSASRRLVRAHERVEEAAQE